MQRLRTAWRSIVDRALRAIETPTLWAAWDPAVAITSDLVTMAREFEAAAYARYAAILERASLPQERGAAITAVTLIHVIVALALLLGLRSHFPVASHEVEMTLGGPIGATTPPPKFIVPKLPTALPPLAPSEDTFQANVVQPAGSPNVTMPAQAIAAEHAFPPLPADLPHRGGLLVRLVISITPDGAIDDATVQQSCGISALDDLAIAWVKAHWRYTPAMQNGQAIAVTTTAVVAFSSA